MSADLNLEMFLESCNVSFDDFMDVPHVITQRETLELSHSVLNSHVVSGPAVKVIEEVFFLTSMAPIDSNVVVTPIEKIAEGLGMHIRSLTRIFKSLSDEGAIKRFPSNIGQGKSYWYAIYDFGMFERNTESLMHGKSNMPKMHGQENNAVSEFVNDQNYNINIALTHKYAFERPSTFMEFMKSIMAILPASIRAGARVESSLQNTNLLVRTLDGENVAHKSDIKTLMACCIILEDVIVKTFHENVKIGMEDYSFRIDATKIIDMLYASGKTSGAHILRVFDSLKRLSHTTIHPKNQVDYIPKNETFDFKSQEIKFLTSAEIDKKGDRCCFVIEIDKRIARTIHRKVISEQSGIKNIDKDAPMAMLIDNSTLKQIDKTILRIEMLMYSTFLNDANSAFLTWGEVWKEVEQRASKTKIREDIELRIVKSPTSEKVGEATYRLDGLLWELSKQGLRITMLDRKPFNNKSFVQKHMRLNLKNEGSGDAKELEKKEDIQDLLSGLNLEE